MCHTLAGHPVRGFVNIAGSVHKSDPNKQELSDKFDKMMFAKCGLSSVAGTSSRVPDLWTWKKKAFPHPDGHGS
jgi:hypothetical protein